MANGSLGNDASQNTTSIENTLAESAEKCGTCTLVYFKVIYLVRYNLDRILFLCPFTWDQKHSHLTVAITDGAYQELKFVANYHGQNPV